MTLDPEALEHLARVVVSPRWRVSAKLGEDVWIMADAGEGKATFIADFGMGVVAMMHAGEVVALRDALPGIVAELRALREFEQAWRAYLRGKEGAVSIHDIKDEADRVTRAMLALEEVRAQRGKGAGDA